MEELVKIWGPFGVAGLAACLAWMYRREERRDDAYAEWAAAIYQYAGAAMIRDLEVQRERLLDAHSNLLAARARVLLLERDRDLRKAVVLLSDMSELGADAPERIPLSVPAGMWPSQFFFERKMRRVDLFVSDLAEAGFFERWNVRLKEPTWEPLPPRRDRPSVTSDGSPLR